MTWETVVGLEVHCELATKTKLFCSCPNEFGAEPNTSVCPVCLGLPGSLPVLNEAVVEYALRVGEALHCRVPETSIFHRKNYFYPDMPKNFQISQYDEPVCVDGYLDIPGVGGVPRDAGGRVGIERAHIEEDTGKTLHVGAGGRIHDADHSLVDYNRAGVPLMEIVSRPDIRSSEEARAYVTELRAVLEAIGVSDVKMEEGSLRIDANVSLREEGTEVLGTKVEIKNMNSLRSLARALEFEVARQAAVLAEGGRITQETRHWDEEAGRTHPLRSKEEAFDYRYFPEPDLVPLAPPAEWQERVRASMPELPSARRRRLVEEWGISDHDAGVLLTSGLADYAGAAVAAGAPGREVTNWVVGDLLAYIHGGHARAPGVNETGADRSDLALTAEDLAELVGLVGNGILSRPLAKEVLAAALAGEGTPRQIAAARGLAQVSDEAELVAVVDGVLSASPAEVARYRDGDEKERKKLRGFFMGKVMAATKGRGNPQVLNRLLDERLPAG